MNITVSVTSVENGYILSYYADHNRSVQYIFTTLEGCKTKAIELLTVPPVVAYANDTQDFANQVPVFDSF